MNNLWRMTGTIESQKLTESRLQMHYAIQFIAATGAALAEPLPDYSHTSLQWNPELEIFVGTLIRATEPFQVGLEPVSLTSIILDKQGDTIATFPLHQQTMVKVLRWHKQEITKLGVDATNIEFLNYPADDFLDYAVTHGAAFDANREQLGRQELANYYGNTHQILQEIVTATEENSAIHIWSHHFDIATLITFPGTKNGQLMTIGIGMSPGDNSYNEPYWYVSPYPYPDTANLPELKGGGFWHIPYWVGAVLTASQLSGEGDMLHKQITDFLNSALFISKDLLRDYSIN